MDKPILFVFTCMEYSNNIDRVIACREQIEFRVISLFKALSPPSFQNKVRKKGKVQESLNQVPHLTQDITWESDQNHKKYHTQEPRG